MNKTSMAVIIISFLLSLCFFSPLLLGNTTYLNFSGDLQNLYFPQFVNSYYMMGKTLIDGGIDFFTGNGASVYSLRPNIPVFYPIYQLAYLIFPFNTLAEQTLAFGVVILFHSCLCIYFCIQLGRKFFKFDLDISILFASLYAFAITKWFSIVPFYFAPALFPLLIYAALCAISEKRLSYAIFYSIPYVLTFLSGYLPLAVHAVLLSILFVAIYYFKFHKNDHNFFKVAFRVMLPVVIASLIVLPAYLGILHYHHLVPGSPLNEWSVAQEFGYSPSDILAIITSSVPGSVGEAPHVIVGLVPVLLILIGVSNIRKLKFESYDSKLIAVVSLFFFIHLFLAFRQTTGLASIFYYMVPVLGKMHIYGRYLITSSFFFFLVFAILLKYILLYKEYMKVGQWAAIIAIVGITLIIIRSFHIINIKPELINGIDVLSMSLILTALAIASLFYSRAIIFITLVSITFLMQSASFNTFYQFSNPPPKAYENTILFSEARSNALLNYFKSNSDKLLIKYADLTSSIEKFNGVELNYPWMVRNKMFISNYMGYEFHLSLDQDYLNKFPWVGTVDISWLLATGADYIIYDEQSWQKYGANFANLVNQQVPVLDLGYGYKVAKLNQYNDESQIFNNGVISVSGYSKKSIVTQFKSDFSSYVRFNISSEVPVKVNYLLFPNKHLKLKINNIEAPIGLDSKGISEILLNPGEYSVEYYYDNKLQKIFGCLYYCYVFILISLLSWQSMLFINKLRVKKGAYK